MRIKVACPSKMVTGGIELLHQVASELNKHDGVTAEIWYLMDPFGRDIPDEYAKYGNYVNNQINEGDVLLFPEVWANCTNNPQYVNHKKIIYWESVDNYFPHTAEKDWYKFGDNVLHISQSDYSTRFLLQTVGVDPNDVIEITDYINDAFLDADIDTEREKVVLYNPAKGMEYTTKLFGLAPDIKFVPIQHMKRVEIVDKMLHSMVWIDFGNFPGKDRLPREAAACGMCLITAKRGTSRYKKDLNIPEAYKMDNINYADLGIVIKMIRGIFDEFETHQMKFDRFRAGLKKEKANFEKGIEELIERL